MDSAKVGGFILSLRKEKKLTQNDLALLMNISDKTISKWEHGLGCPDVSLLSELSQILGVNIERILSGELQLNDRDSGSMKHVRFYSCKSCGNVMTSTGAIQLSCCGRILEELHINKDRSGHAITVDEIEDDYFVCIPLPYSQASAGLLILSRPLPRPSICMPIYNLQALQFNGGLVFQWSEVAYIKLLNIVE